MKILVFYQHYLGPGEPGGLRYNEFARLWSEAGHDVTVVAGTVNYATGIRRDAHRGRFLSRETDGLTKVLRAHVPATYSSGYIGRMWAFFGFTVSATVAAMAADPPDVVIASSPPLVTAIPGWLASRLRKPRRVPLVFEVRDLWPESAVTTGVLREGAPLTRILYALERGACRAACKVNVLTPAFRQDMVERGLVDPEDVWFFPNGADIDVYQGGPRDNEVRREQGWGDRFVALYAGAHGRANALHQLLDAAERLRNRPDLLIACAGDGPLRRSLTEEARRRNLDNISFLGAFPKERMPEIIRAADLGLAVLQNNPTFRTVYPNKVFDYMSCERPVLLGIDGVIRELVCDRARAGVFARPEDGAALAAAITSIADAPDRGRDMGLRGRAWVLEHAARDAIATEYLGALENLVESRATAARRNEQRDSRFAS